MEIPERLRESLALFRDSARIMLRSDELFTTTTLARRLSIRDSGA